MQLCRGIKDSTHRRSFLLRHDHYAYQGDDSELPNYANQDDHDPPQDEHCGLVAWNWAVRLPWSFTEEHAS